MIAQGGAGPKPAQPWVERKKGSQPCKGALSCARASHPGTTFDEAVIPSYPRHPAAFMCHHAPRDEIRTTLPMPLTGRHCCLALACVSSLARHSIGQNPGPPADGLFRSKIGGLTLDRFGCRFARLIGYDEGMDSGDSENPIYGTV